MPSITGGDSTDRDYAPHMYILGPSETPDNPAESDWIFVGNNGNVYVERDGGTYPNGTQYHIGATVLSEIVCDFTKAGTQRELDPWFKSRAQGIKKHVPNADMPPDVLEEALAKSIDENVITMDRQVLVSGLVLLLRPSFDKVIDFPEPINFSTLFNGHHYDRKREAEKVDAVPDFIAGLKADLGLPLA